MGDITRWQVGNVRISKVPEIEMHWPFKALLPEVTPELLEATPWMRPHFMDEAGKMVLSMHALVVESQGQTIVVDTCIGNDKVRPTRPFNQLSTNFLDVLAQAGFAPEAVDTVFCTHLHVDHVGWNTKLVDGRWVPTFERARHLFTRTEYDYWLAHPDLDMFGDVMGDSVVPIVDAGLADFIEVDHAITDEVWLESTPGHTPGHCSVHIASQGQEAVITGDMTHSPIQFAYPLNCTADADTTQANETRAAFVSRYADTPTLIIGTHFAGPTAGHLVRDGEAWRFAV